MHFFSLFKYGITITALVSTWASFYFKSKTNRLIMKKLLFVLAIMLTLATSAQVSKTANSVTRSTWNRYSQTWDLGTPKAVNITFVLYRDKILANDQAQSKYFILASRPDQDNSQYSSSSWDCYDEAGIKCIFSMTFYKTGRIVYFVIYDNVSFSYNIKTDPFD